MNDQQQTTTLVPQPQTKHINLFFDDMPVRALVNEYDQMEWNAQDVCDILDYGSGTESVLRKLPADEKLMRKLSASGQSRDMLFVTEPGLYRLIFRSNKTEAEAFQRWVFHEVLPTIRKTGSYSVANAAESAILPSILEKIERLDRKFNQLRINSSQVGPAWSFAHAYCDVGSHLTADKDELFQVYREHCHAIGGHPDCKAHFLMRLYSVVEGAYPSAMRRNGRKAHVVRGLGLKPNCATLIDMARREREDRAQRDLDERIRCREALRLPKSPGEVQ